LVRDEAAVPGAIAATAVVLRTPRPVDFARGRTDIERGERRQNQQEQYGADCVHGEPPESGAPSIRISGLFGAERNRSGARARCPSRSTQAWTTTRPSSPRDEAPAITHYCDLGRCPDARLRFNRLLFLAPISQSVSAVTGQASRRALLSRLQVLESSTRT